MTVSTATQDWNSGTLVGAYGTCEEVLAEIGAGASSSATMENREFLMAWGVYYDSTSSTTRAGVLWYNTKKPTDWSA